MRAIVLHPPNDRGTSICPDRQNITQINGLKRAIGAIGAIGVLLP
jgi:hypothetical protein